MMSHACLWLIKAQPQILTGFWNICASEATERPELRAIVPVWPCEIFNSHTVELLTEVSKLYRDHFWTCFRTSVGQLVQFISMSSRRWERRIMSLLAVVVVGDEQDVHFSRCRLMRLFAVDGRREKEVLKEWRKGHFYRGVIIAFCVKTLVPNQQSRKRKKNVRIIKLKPIWCVNSLNFRKKGFIFVLMWAVTGTGTTFRMAVMLPLSSSRCKCPCCQSIFLVQLASSILAVNTVLCWWNVSYCFKGSNSTNFETLRGQKLSCQHLRLPACNMSVFTSHFYLFLSKKKSNILEKVYLFSYISKSMTISPKPKMFQEKPHPKGSRANKQLCAHVIAINFIRW